MRGFGLRRLVYLLTPPLVLQAARAVRDWAARRAAPAIDEFAAASPEPESSSADEPTPHIALEWEMVGDSDEVWSSHEGWSHDSILRMQVDKWPSFLRSVAGAGALGQSHEAAADASPDYATHNTIMTFGYVVGRAAAGKSTVSVLDWGGGVGHYSGYARALFPNLQFDYTVKDFSGFCTAGAGFSPDVRFVSDEAAALSRSYDLVFASSSLHYTRDVYDLLDRLCNSAGSWLMITRTPIVEHNDDFVVVQRPYAYGYLTEYPGWFINRKRLLSFVAGRGFELERQFLVAEEPNVPNAPERAHYYGFLFRRTATAG